MLVSFPRRQMTQSEIIRQKTQSYHSKVRTALSSMPPMTSGEFYTQMQKSLGKKNALIDPSKGSIKQGEGMAGKDQA